MEINEKALDIIEQFGRRVQSSVQDAESLITRSNRFIGAVDEASAIVKRIAVLPSAEHIGYIGVAASYEDEHPVFLHLTIAKDHQDSPILREIVSAGIVSRIEKSKHYDGKSLDARFNVGSVGVLIQGYIPQTCRIVEEPVVEPASDDYYTDATGKIFRRTVKQRIECTDDPAPTSTTNGVPQA